MKVCISRNAEARTNAALARVADALCDALEEICILSRSRYSGDKKRLVRRDYQTSGRTIDNYEIILRSKPGRGLINIFQLIGFQARAISWFLRNRNRYDLIHAFDLDVGLPAL